MVKDFEEQKKALKELQVTVMSYDKTKKEKYKKELAKILVKKETDIFNVKEVQLKNSLDKIIKTINN